MLEVAGRSVAEARVRVRARGRRVVRNMVAVFVVELLGLIGL